MADKIELAIDDQTEDGAKSAEQSLDRVVAATEALTKALEQLVTASQDVEQTQEQVTRVVNEETVSWKKLAASGIEATSEIAAGAIALAATMAKLRFAQDLVAKAQAALASGTAALARSHTALNAALDVTEKLAIRGAGHLIGYGAAAASATTILGGFTAGLKAHNAILSVTGRQYDETTGKITTNLDRAQEAWNDLGEDLSTFGAGAAEVAQEAVRDVTQRLIDSIPGIDQVKEGWAEFDRRVTEGTNNFVVNMRAIGSAVRGVEREVVEASERVAAAQAASADDFERVRQANAAIAEAAKQRAEAEQTASLATAEAVDAEIQKLRERAGLAAAQNKFDEQAQADLVRREADLQTRRRQLEAEERQRHEAALKEDERRAKEAQDYQDQIYEDGIDRMNKAAMDHNDRIEKERQKALDDYRKEQEERVRIWFAAEDRINAEAKKKADERLEILKAEHEARVKMIQDANGGQLLNQARQALDPRAVAQRVGEQRAAAAREQFTRENVGGLDASDPAAVRRFNAQRNAAAAAAGRQGFRDVATGRAKDQEVLGAQNALVQASAQQANANGELSNAMLRALTQAVNNDQQSAMQLAQQAQQIKSLEQALGVVGGSLQNTRARAQSGGLRR